MLKTVYEFSNGRGDVIVQLLCDSLGDFTIRVYRVELDEILEISDGDCYHSRFDSIFSLIKYHRNVEKEYFKISDNTAPIDRDQFIKDDLEALADRMEDIITAICAIC